MESMSIHGVMSSHVIDTTKRNKNIRFDETESTGTLKKRKLLDSDEEDEFKFPDDNERNYKSKTKLSKLQVGNDQRFILDDRFIEEEDLEEKNEEVENEFSEERKMQLEILGDVLGTPIFTENRKRTERKEAFKSAGNMIRYDPTDEKHHEYEIVPPKPEKVKKQKRKETEKVKESEPLPVSNEVFYSVSDKLTNALREGEQFSLFKTLGKDATEPSTEQPEICYKLESKEKRFGFNFDSRKAFKYDSSDDEDPSADFSAEAASKKLKSDRVDSSNSNVNSERFLFIIDDPRFQECEEFFKNRSERSEDLKTLRPKLKQTIRKRIRTNLKKNSVLHKRKLKRQKY